MTERRHKVLVADDDESVRESLRKLLHGEGYQVILAADGVEALETFRREKGRIDLLLVDLNMPLKNGWATVDRLLELDCSPPVLILTGLSHQSELAQAAGVSALVEKPVDVPALLELMRELLVK
ncbi:MAG: response regulator, partial [Verrucomicrobiota bacterium]|nr:response regulator [Verrucomicrobiota bacterium]